MLSAERLILNDNVGKEFTDYAVDDWLSILQHVIAKLHDLFGEEFVYRKEDYANIKDGFSIGFYNKKPLLSPLDISLRGILGCNILGINESVCISATIFLYSGSQRISLNNKCCYELVYKSTLTDGNWEVIGWEIDEFEEYDFYETISRPSFLD